MKFTIQKDSHYYGDVVRILFLIAAVLLMLSVPLYREIFPFDTVSTILFILIIGLLAGLTNPRQYWVVIADSIVSGVSFVLFEYFAFEGSNGFHFIDTPFYVKQSLALIFFYALYYSVKTFRAEYLERKNPPAEEVG